MDPSRYNLNYSMSSIGILSEQADMYSNPAAMAALGSRPPSGGLLQSMSGSPGVGFPSSRSGGGAGLIQCQASSSNLNSGGGGAAGSNQQRGIKRAGSDCYEDHHRGSGGGGGGNIGTQSLQGLEQGQHQSSTSGGNLPDVGEDSYSSIQSKKSPPANGKKTKGRVKIKMEYIDNKLRRYTTFSKRKTGIMKKAYELSTLTGTQVMLLVASETGHVYTFATRKLQPMITSEAGKQLIQTCLNSPDPPSAGGGDQRMSATGFEETELSYNIADEDSKDDERSSSANDSDDSSDFDSPNTERISTQHSGKCDIAPDKNLNSVRTATEQQQQQQQQPPMEIAPTIEMPETKITPTKMSPAPSSSNYAAPSTMSNIPHDVLLQLIQSGHLQLHTEEDGSGHQYVSIPLGNTAANLLKTNTKKNVREVTKENHGTMSRQFNQNMTTPKANSNNNNNQSNSNSNTNNNGLRETNLQTDIMIKQELE